MEGVDQMALTRSKRVFGDGFDVGDDVLDGFRHEGAKDELPQLGVVVALVKEDGLFAQHPLFAGGECGLEEMGSREEHEFRGLRARDHDTRAPQDVRLEDGAIPTIQKQSNTI